MRFAPLLLLALLAAACAPNDAPNATADPSAPRTDGVAEVHVEDAWVRPVRGTPTAPTNSAAYFTLRNRGDARAHLVAASVEGVEITEIHETTMDDGVMRMRPAERVEVPPGEEVAFQPAGLHVMLLGVRQELAEGDTLGLTLRFEDGTTHTAQALVRSPF